MQKGTIAKLMSASGYGFIKKDDSQDGEKDLFFHAREVQGVTYDELKEGEAVTFEITDGPKGPSATNVSRA